MDKNIEYNKLFPLLIYRNVRVGGKDSTDFVVKGSHTDVPEDLIGELKNICHV